MMRSFREYQPNERRNYITLSTGEYYPDILVDACKLYSPVLTIFSDILHHSGSSVSLFLSISEVSNQWMRTQLCRVFRKYVSPETPVEMLKKNTNAFVWNRPYEPWEMDRIIEQYPCIDPKTGKRYKKVPIHAPGTRNGETGKAWRGKMPPPGKHWQYTPQKLDELDAAGEIYWSPTGNPRRMVFFDSDKGIPIQDIWLNYRDSVNQSQKTTGYPTEKNLDMLKMIVAASSNPGDIVLDCFAGSGTTLDAAFELGRLWIGADNSIESYKAIKKRFTDGLERYGDYVSDQTCKQVTLSLSPRCPFDVLSCDEYATLLMKSKMKTGTDK